MLRAFICVLSLALLAPSFAFADESEPRAQALEKAHRGRELYDSGQWREAYAEFQAAEELHHAPTLLLYMARCQRKLGDKSAARALYEKVVAERLGKNAPAPFVEAQRDAEKELAEVRAEMAPREKPSTPAPPGATAAAKRGPLWPGIATLGLGGAGIAVGAVTGALSLAKVSSVASRCVDKQCTIADRPEVDQAVLLGDVSTAAFVIGGVAVAAGVALLLTRPGGEKSVHVGVGFGWANVHVRF